MLKLKRENQDASTASHATSEEDVERITRVVLAVLEARAAAAAPPDRESRAKRLGSFLLSNWQLTGLLIAIVALVIATAIYGTSPLYYVKQLAMADQELDAKRREFEYRQGMADRYIVLGTRLLDQGRFEDAGHAFAEALEFDPHSVEARLGHHKAGVFAPAARGEFDPAVIEQRINSVFANPATGEVVDPHALAALGDLMYDTHRYDVAQTYFNQAIERRGRLAHAHARLGDIALRTDDFTTAAAGFQRAHELAPSHSDYLTNLASALIYAGKYDAAVDRCQDLFQLDPERLSPYVECALASRLRGDFHQSLAILAYALDYFMNDNVLALSKNDADWFFVLDGERHYLMSTGDKRAYAYHTAQASAHLADDLAAVKEPDAAAPDATEPVVEAIAAEARELRSRQPEAAAELEAYVRTLKGHADGED